MSLVKSRFIKKQGSRNVTFWNLLKSSRTVEYHNIPWLFCCLFSGSRLRFTRAVTQFYIKATVVTVLLSCVFMCQLPHFTDLFSSNQLFTFICEIIDNNQLLVNITKLFFRPEKENIRVGTPHSTPKHTPRSPPQGIKED